MSKETKTMNRKALSEKSSRLRRLGGVVVMATVLGALLGAATPAAAAPKLRVYSDHLPSAVAQGTSTTFEVAVLNVGDTPGGGPLTVEVTLPEGMRVDKVSDDLNEFSHGSFPAWDCSVGAEQRHVDCEGPTNLFGDLFEFAPPGETCKDFVGGKCRILITASAEAGASGEGSVAVKACGGGAPTCARDTDPTPMRQPGPFSLLDWDSDWTIGKSGAAFSQAGGHPYSVVNAFDLAKHNSQFTFTEKLPDGGALRNVVAKLPAGFIGAPNAMPTCPGAADLVPEDTPFDTNNKPSRCPINSVIGIIEIKQGEDRVNSAPIFNMKPPPGVPAQFGFQVLGFPVFLNATLRSDGDYGVNINSANISQGLPVSGVVTTFWGVPGDPSHDYQRCDLYAGGQVGAKPGSDYCEGEPGTNIGPNASSVGAIKPFLTNPTGCTAPGTGRDIPLHADDWEQPAASDEASFITHEAGDPSKPVGNDGCDVVPFEPKITAQPTTDRAESPSGLEVNVTVPTDGINNPDGIAQSSLKDAKVTLPEGMTLNPSYADGVSVCSADEIGLTTGNSPDVHFNLEPSHCPDAAQIGSVHIETPLVDFPLDGAVYVADQYDANRPGAENPFDSLLALYIVAGNKERGFSVKLAGKVSPDPNTGQITTTFLNNPQIAFSRLQLKLKGGQRAPLATPSACGSFTTVGDFTPYARPSQPVRVSDSFRITKGPDGNLASCVSSFGARPFHPTMIAGTENNSAGSYSPFALRMLRADGEQELTSFSADLPPGLSARLAGVAKCRDAAIEVAKSKSGAQEIASPSCPAASAVGRTLVGFGTGSILTYSPGKLYLAGPYHGTPLSVVSITAAKVGPFDLGTVVVRSAFKIDPDDAQAHIDSKASDPLPHIIQGVNTHIRDVRAIVDRPNFTLNPTNCSPMAITARLTGTGAELASKADDVPVDLFNRFQAADCQALGFKPKLSFKLKGGTHRGDFPAFEANLTARPGDANIAGATVTLPRTEFIEQNHIRTVCTRVQFAADQCPAKSVYGYVKASTPLLDKPVEGPVYLRSNGGERVLPDLVAALHGEINVDLVGYIDSVKGRIRNTFEVVPDAPVTKFTLKMQGGKKGLLANHLNLCTASGRADVKLRGQNGKLSHTHPLIGTSCKRARAHKRRS